MGLSLSCAGGAHGPKNCLRRSCTCYCHANREEPLDMYDCDLCDAGPFPNPQGLGAHRRHKHPGTAKRRTTARSRPAAPAPEPRTPPPSATPRDRELAVVPANPPNSTSAAQLPITEEALDVLSAVAFLDDEPPAQVLAAALDEWVRARLEDPDVADVVKIRKLRRAAA